MKKTLALVLALLLAVSLLSASFAVAEDRPTITWLQELDGNVPEMTEIQQILCDKFGINLQIIYVSTSDYATKLNTLIAANTLPDIFSTSGQIALDLRDAGMLADLAPYLEEYGPDLLQLYKDANAPLDELEINTDGKVYALHDPRGGYISNFIVRKDWLEKVNLSVPTTIDELYEVLRAFRYDDPDGNGEQDTWGFAACMGEDKNWQHVFAAYGIPFGKNIELADGTDTRYVKHPNYLNAVKFFNRLYQEGIMDPNFATETFVEYAEALWNGKIGIFDFQSPGPLNNWYPGRYTFEVPENPEDLFAVTDFKNVDTGEVMGAPKEYSSKTKYGVLVSAKCAAPEKAVELINYIRCTEEGQFLTYLGVEGKMYQWIDKANGKYERLGDYKDDAYHRSAGAFIYSNGGGWSLENAETRTMNAFTQKAQIDENKLAMEHVFFGKALESWAEYGTSLQALEKEMLANLIVSTGDLEAEYQEFMERWVEEGGAEFEEEATEAWKNR